MKIETSQIADLIKIAQCHKIAFPHTLSSKMGSLFIKKMLSWYIVDQRGILFHVSENNQIIGYCGGIIIKEAGLPGAASSITQHSFKVFILSFLLRPWLIFHKENRSRFSFIKKNLFVKLGFAKKNLSADSRLINSFESSWGLVVIGVNPKFRGKGLGSNLLQEFERLARIDGVQKISLTVKSNNKKAIKVYENNGWISGSQNEDSLNMYKKL